MGTNLLVRRVRMCRRPVSKVPAHIISLCTLPKGLFVCLLILIFFLPSIGQRVILLFLFVRSLTIVVHVFRTASLYSSHVCGNHVTFQSRPLPDFSLPLFSHHCLFRSFLPFPGLAPPRISGRILFR